MNSPVNHVDEIIITDELGLRPTRLSDFEAESQALVALAEAMAESPKAILQQLAEAARRLCRAEGAGISLRETDRGQDIFRWHATAGSFSRYRGGVMPGDFSPCGIVIDRNAMILMAEPDRYFPYLEDLTPAIDEVLLVPFYRAGIPIGTLWVVAQSETTRFDLEDARVLTNLSQFASAAVRTLQNLERSRLLAEASEVLLTAEEPDAMLRGIFAKIAGPLGVDTYFNFMVSESENFLRLESCHGIPHEESTRIRRLEFGQAVCGMVALHRTPIVKDCIQDSAEPMVQLVKSYGIRAYACNPLMAGDRLLGTLSFATRTRNEFDPSELEFFRTIAIYVSNAYERMALISQLKQSDRRKDEFLAMLAHELRNPLSAIGNAVTLATRSKQYGNIEWAIDVIVRQMKHLTRLIDDLLDVSRISRGKIDLKRIVLELTPLLESAATTTKPLFEERNHRLEIMIDRDNLWASVDSTRFEQVVVNLLNNAAKYSDNGANVRLSARNEGDEIVISVRDNGHGMLPEKLPHMFELFTQGDRSLARSEGGLGIGLTVVKKLVEMHGGGIEAQSEGPGRGSEFTVRLPRTSRPGSSTSREPFQVAAEQKSARILVIDDSVDTARGMAMLLGILGHEVKVAHNGPDGIEHARKQRPEFVLLDIGLPGMDGYEIASRLRKEDYARDAVIVAVSGYGQEEDRRRSMEAGFDHHFLKPVDHDALIALISAVGAGEPGSV